MEPKVSDVLGELVEDFHWKLMHRGAGDTGVYQAMVIDPPAEWVCWIHDIPGRRLFCVVVFSVLPSEREAEALRFAAQVNHGLPFGCLEYSFEDRRLRFRDAIDLEWGDLRTLVNTVTYRVLDLAGRHRREILCLLDRSNGAALPLSVLE